MKNKIIYNGRTFSAADIKDGQIHLAASLPAMRLEPNTFTVTLKSETSLTSFTRNTPMYYYRNERLHCIMYVQSVERVGRNSYKFYATSTIGLLIDGTHNGGIYTGQTAESVILDIVGDIPCCVKTDLQDVKLYGWLPIASQRDNLSQVLFALGATVKTDLDGVLRIENFWDGISGTVLDDKMYAAAAVDYSAKVTQIIVTEHQYNPSQEEKKLFEGVSIEGDIITFSEPMHSLSATGFRILEQGVNYAKLSSGNGTLTGKTYLHTTRQLSRTLSSEKEQNVKRVDNATLVSLVNSSAVCQWLSNYYMHAETLDAPVVYEGDQPGDRLCMYSPFDRVLVDACVESADITISNTLKASVKALTGFVPINPNTTDYYNTQKVLKGRGSFLVPEGVTNLRYVLIQGGQGGKAGKPGGAGSRVSVSYEERYNTRQVLSGRGNFTVPEGVTNLRYVLIQGGQGGKAGRQGGEGGTLQSVSFTHRPLSTVHNYSGYCPGPGGAGGLGGDPGHGGRVLEGKMSVTPGQVIQWECGIGGLGAVFDASNPDAEGQEGGHTVFGTASTVNGSYTASGWTDPTTGESYGLLGLQGLPGGKGGGKIDGHVVNSLESAHKVAPPEAAVDEDGVSWAGGVTTLDSNGWIKVSGQEATLGTVQAGWIVAEASVNLASGGAAGAQGNSSLGYGTAWATRGTSSVTGYAASPKGLPGANATLVPHKAPMTNGGRGGYGGGGGSSAGVALIGKVGAASGTVSGGEKGPGGNGGQGGQGGDGLIILFFDLPGAVDTDSDPVKYTGYGPGPGGAGGLGGDPGHGGRVLEGEMSVTPGQVIQWECGIGGLGAAFDASNPDAEGQEGGHTTFGTASTVDGSYTSSGWTDVTTGETYGLPGLQGLPGGKGGGQVSGNSTNTQEGIYQIAQAEAAVDEDGVSWAGGATELDSKGRIRTQGSDVSYGSSYLTADASITLGSGGAAGTPGASSSAYGEHSAYMADNKLKGHVTGPAGLAGATPSKIPHKASATSGGRGGYGGGGGSSPGLGVIGKRGTGPFDAKNTAGQAGPGGNGGQGGQGGDGLIILYYSAKIELPSGALATADGWWFADRLGRWFVV